MSHTGTVLITGAQGFIGRFVAARWLSERPSWHVVGLGRSPQLPGFTHRVCWGGRTLRAPLPRGLENVSGHPRYAYHQVDLHDEDSLVALLRHHAPQIVIHLATVLRGEHSRALELGNPGATAALIRAISTAGPDRPTVVLGSSGGVYGVPATLPIPEDHPCEPLYPYARSKLEAEEIAVELCHARAIPLLRARIFNPLGPGQDERHLCGRLANLLAEITVGAREPAVELMPLDATRDFQDVRDVAAALLCLAERGAAGSIYNVASGLERPTIEVWERLLRAATARGAPAVTLRWLPGRPSDVPRHQGRVERLHALGHRDHVSLEQSLEDLLDYYLEDVAHAASEEGSP